MKTLAQKGFDIGFGAKKNFASYDLINKLPGWTGFISLAVGIIQIAYQNIPFNKELSILLIFVGIAIIYIDVFKNKVDKYNEEGIRLTRLYNSIRDLYNCVKADNQFEYSNYELKYQNIISDFYSNSISKQVFLSQWFAHFKFFYEMQTDWIENELSLSFFKDKLPNSLKITLTIVLLLTLICIFHEYLLNLCGIRK
ncbi:SLATT domain-containing protein [Parasegetibacter sp. MAH-26]|uniref:SLATT domain-containing protein n=1 Tax=Pinibacter aurantiacus TaxID=2851599 RepID=A0A9E2W3Z9_9BACT|nr:SLATT domain-containing protein [Pinibacter aurantiacus]